MYIKLNIQTWISLPLEYQKQCVHFSAFFLADCLLIGLAFLPTAIEYAFFFGQDVYIIYNTVHSTLLVLVGHPIRRCNSYRELLCIARINYSISDTNETDIYLLTIFCGETGRCVCGNIDHTSTLNICLVSMDFVFGSFVRKERNGLECIVRYWTGNFDIVVLH